jgi:hypothetical protein
MIRQLRAKLLHWIDPEPEVVVNADLLREMLKDNEVYKKMTIAKLKPCPFCGGAVRMYSTSRKHAFIVEHMGLNNCAFYEFDIPWEFGESIEHAAELWNRRISDE